VIHDPKAQAASMWRKKHLLARRDGSNKYQLRDGSCTGSRRPRNRRNGALRKRKVWNSKGKRRQVMQVDAARTVAATTLQCDRVQVGLNTNERKVVEPGGEMTTRGPRDTPHNHANGAGLCHLQCQQSSGITRSQEQSLHKIEQHEHEELTMQLVEEADLMEAIRHANLQLEEDAYTRAEIEAEDAWWQADLLRDIRCSQCHRLKQCRCRTSKEYCVVQMVNAGRRRKYCCEHCCEDASLSKLTIMAGPNRLRDELQKQVVARSVFSPPVQAARNPNDPKEFCDGLPPLYMATENWWRSHYKLGCELYGNTYELLRDFASMRESIEVLLAHGANPNWVLPKKVLRQTNYGMAARSFISYYDDHCWHGTTPLHNVATYGDAACIHALVSGGARLDAQDSRMYTALHAAVDANNAHTTLALLLLGANASVLNRADMSALEKAEIQGCNGVAQVIRRVTVDLPQLCAARQRLAFAMVVADYEANDHKSTGSSFPEDLCYGVCGELHSPTPMCAVRTAMRFPCSCSTSATIMDEPSEDELEAVFLRTQPPSASKTWRRDAQLLTLKRTPLLRPLTCCLPDSSERPVICEKERSWVPGATRLQGFRKGHCLRTDRDEGFEEAEKGTFLGWGDESFEVQWDKSGRKRHASYREGLSELQMECLGTLTGATGDVDE